MISGVILLAMGMLWHSTALPKEVHFIRHLNLKMVLQTSTGHWKASHNFHSILFLSWYCLVLGWHLPCSRSTTAFILKDSIWEWNLSYFDVPQLSQPVGTEYKETLFLCSRHQWDKPRPRSSGALFAGYSYTQSFPIVSNSLILWGYCCAGLRFLRTGYCS